MLPSVRFLSDIGSKADRDADGSGQFIRGDRSRISGRPRNESYSITCEVRSNRPRISLWPGSSRTPDRRGSSGRMEVQRIFVRGEQLE